MYVRQDGILFYVKGNSFGISFDIKRNARKKNMAAWHRKSSEEAFCESGGTVTCSLVKMKELVDLYAKNR